MNALDATSDLHSRFQQARQWLQEHKNKLHVSEPLKPNQLLQPPGFRSGRIHSLYIYLRLTQFHVSELLYKTRGMFTSGVGNTERCCKIQD
jgi:hypothetical protein